MSNPTYYSVQHTARGLANEEQLAPVLAQIFPVYDRVMGKWLPASRESAIYEAACGPGIFLRWLSREGYRAVHASDFAQSYVELSKLTGYPVVLGDSIADLDSQPEGCLDVVIAIDFIEHLQRETFQAFLRIAHQKLRPGGCLILRAPNGDSPVVGRNLFNDITHVWAYSTICLAALARVSGFQHVEFVDDTVISVIQQRWFRVPMMRIAQFLLKTLLWAATRERLKCLGASYYARLIK